MQWLESGALSVGFFLSLSIGDCGGPSTFHRTSRLCLRSRPFAHGTMKEFTVDGQRMRVSGDAPGGQFFSASGAALLSAALHFQRNSSRAHPSGQLLLLHESGASAFLRCMVPEWSSVGEEETTELRLRKRPLFGRLPFHSVRVGPIGATPHFAGRWLSDKFGRRQQRPRRSEHSQPESFYCRTKAATFRPDWHGAHHARTSRQGLAKLPQVSAGRMCSAESFDEESGRWTLGCSATRNPVEING